MESPMLEQDLILSLEKTKLQKDHLGTSVIVPDYQDGQLPLKSLLEEPLISTQDDINILWKYYTGILGSLSNDFNRHQSDIEAINKLIGDVQNKSAEYQLSSSDESSLFLWASDSFTSTSNIDLSNTTAYIDTSAGIATLGVTKLTSLTANIESFTIDLNNSTGIPGNNLVVSSNTNTSTPDSSNQEPQVVLESTNYALVGNMFDERPDTWLEWEHNYIPRIQKCKSIQTAWEKDPAGQSIDIVQATKDNSDQPAGWRKFIQWPGSKDINKGPDGKGFFIADFEKDLNAKITFTITFNEPQKMSAVQITPKILGGIYPIVRDITIYNEIGVSKTIAKNVFLTEKLNEGLNPEVIGIPRNAYTGIGLWAIEDTLVKRITFSLEANGSYNPPLGFGHHYYFRITNKRTDTHVLFFSFVDNDQDTERLPNPDDHIQTGLTSQGNLSALGNLVGFAVAGPAAALIGSAAGSLFSQEKSTDILRQGDAYDIFDGKRSAIGIKDIDISVREYNTQGIITSKAYYFPQGVKSVSVISTEKIPESWDLNTEWISYEVSSEKTDWVKITPQNRVNSLDTVASMNGANNIYLRITMRRPLSDINTTPHLLNVALKAVGV